VRIAYLRADGIYLIGIDGRGLRRLAKFARSSRFLEDECLGGPIGRDWCQDFGIDWSRDGRRVAYDGTRGIVVARADGTGASQLTFGEDSLPRWSPDGRQLAFQRIVAGGVESDIFVVNRDGSGLRRLTFTHSQMTRRPSWSLDGSRIAYDGDGFFYVMNRDGSEQRKASAGSSATWSPTGSEIVFDYKGKIGTYGVDDGRRHILTGGRPRIDAYAQWSVDGRSIIFARASRYQWDVYAMTARGENVENLTNTPRPTWEIAPAWSSTRP
jgi:Tol biopolymer transport system component